MKVETKAFFWKKGKSLKQHIRIQTNIIIVWQFFCKFFLQLLLFFFIFAKNIFLNQKFYHNCGQNKTGNMIFFFICNCSEKVFSFEKKLFVSFLESFPWKIKKNCNILTKSSKILEFVLPRWWSFNDLVKVHFYFSYRWLKEVLKNKIIFSLSQVIGSSQYQEQMIKTLQNLDGTKEKKEFNQNIPFFVS